MKQTIELARTESGPQHKAAVVAAANCLIGLGMPREQALNCACSEAIRQLVERFGMSPRQAAEEVTGWRLEVAP